MFPLSFFVMLYSVAKRAPNKKKTVFSTVKVVIVAGIVYCVAFGSVYHYMLIYEEDDLFVIEFVCFMGANPPPSRGRWYDNGTHTLNMNCIWYKNYPERDPSSDHRWTVWG